MKFSTQLTNIFPRSLSSLLVVGTLTLLAPQGIAATITGFTDVYAPNNWNTRTTGSAMGTVTQDTTILDISLDSGNISDYLEHTISIDASRAGNLQFSWNFLSLEIAGRQTAGYVLNDNYTSLVTSTGDTDSNGDPILVSSTSPILITVAAGDIFGLRFQAEDDTTAPGIFNINGFSAIVADPVVPNPTSVPEPNTLPLIGGVLLLGVGNWAKRKLANSHRN